MKVCRQTAPILCLSKKLQYLQPSLYLTEPLVILHCAVSAFLWCRECSLQADVYTHQSHFRAHCKLSIRAKMTALLGVYFTHTDLPRERLKYSIRHLHYNAPSFSLFDWADVESSAGCRPKHKPRAPEAAYFSWSSSLKAAAAEP